MTHHLPEGAGFEFSRKINTQPVGMEEANGGIAEDEMMPPIDPEMERIAQLYLPELFDTLLKPLRRYLDSLEPHEERRVVEELYHTFSDSYRLGVYEASQEIQGQLEDAIPPLVSTAVVAAIGRFLAQEGETGGLNERKPEVLDAGVARSWIEWFKYALYNGDFNAVDWNVENNPVDVILSIALEVYGKGPSQDEMAQVRRMLQQMAKDYLIGDKEGAMG